MRSTLQLFLALAVLGGCTASDSRPMTWSSSTAILAPSESRPAWTLRSYGGDGFDSVAAVASMPDGGLVLAGHFEGELELGSDRLMSAGGTDAFIARLGSDGEVEWAARLGGRGFDAATAVAVDRAGNPVLIGALSGSVRAGDRQLRASGESDIFAASYGADGAIVWAVAFGDTGWDTAAAAALTSDGDIAVVGSSGAMARDGMRARADGSDVLVAVVGSAGNLRWTRSFGGIGWDQGFAVAAFREGDIAVAGSFGDRLPLGDRMLASAGLSDGFVVRLSSDGRVQSAQRLGGEGADAVTALAIAPDGTYDLAGHFSGTMRAGGDLLTSAGDSDLFVTRQDAAGQPVWAIRAGGAGTDTAGALLPLPDGSILVAASYSLALELVASGPSEVVLHHVGDAGGRRDLLRLSGSLVSARGLATTPDGAAIVVGSFARQARLGSSAIEAQDQLDGYVATTSLAAWGK